MLASMSVCVQCLCFIGTQMLFGQQQRYFVMQVFGVAVGIMSLKNAGDGHTVSCSCLLISRSNGFICERLRFLPSQTANPLWPVSAIHSCCFHHMVSCCHIFPCYVLDLSVSVMMTPSSQITL